ncbi:TetR/AcrR family transcriptional regulator [Nocardia transvalensis]|uniref:TetR/AcrR family transcriptional regulator n=1 Tax=Nocardia transvalensis TaxID=37333 RepID=UPI001895E5DB|nr:TetR/AcrR family transcriptional regulator [Nocardia transvalensis]MBF6330127.1 TetR/AcrR family transcriptional regulator [Nocardia transvalensis]
MGDGEIGLRERKKERTRRALLRAAYRLFEEKGYDRTTTSEIAHAAEVSPGTFFNYFGTKEELVFGDRSEVIGAGLRVLARREPGDAPADALLRAFDAMQEVTRLDDPEDEFEQNRARLLFTVPTLYGAMLQRTFAAQERMTAALRESFPHLDETTAAAMVGAFIGAAISAVRAAALRGDPLTEALVAAIRLVGDNFR